MNAVIIDIEADQLYLYQKNIWTICMKRVRSSDKLTIHPFRMTKDESRQAILDFLFECENPMVVGHNILGFDMWVLWKELGLDIHVGRDTVCNRPVTFFDTLFASQFVWPDRPDGHSLESWGVRLGKHKIPYRTIALELGIIKPEENEFCRWSPQMDEYCQNDTEVNEKIFMELYPQVQSTLEAFKLGQKNFFLMHAQTFTGFKFDKEKAISLKPQIDKMIDELKKEVEPDLPTRKLKQKEAPFYTIPARPFRRDKSFSSTMISFMMDHDADVVSPTSIRVNGKVIEVEPGKRIMDEMPMSLSDQKELKEYFLKGTVTEDGRELYDEITWIEDASKKEI